MNQELLEQVKRKLAITWDDVDTTTRINDIINSAIPDMIDTLGITEPNFDFSKPSPENALFLNRCLYEWNNILNVFYDEYRKQIQIVRNSWLVKESKTNGVIDDAEVKI